MKYVRRIALLLALLLLAPPRLAAAEETPEDPPPAEEATAQIAVVGDIMALSAQIGGARKKSGGYDFRYVFRYVQPILEGADLAIGNLETPVAGSEYPYTDGRYKNGYPRLNAPEALLKAVKKAGFDILSTANNHSLDCGEKGLVNTIRAVKKHGMEPVGTYRTKKARAQPLIADANGIKVAVLAYTVCTNRGERKLSREKRKYMYNVLNLKTMKKDIRAAKKAGAEFVVVMAHWGSENRTRSNSSQRSMAKAIAKMGADVIIGSHPHVLQPAGRIVSRTPYGKKSCFVAYSLGNFVSSMSSARNRDGAILRLTVRRNEKGAVRLEKAQCIATRTFSSYKGRRFVALPYYGTRDYKASAKTVRALRASYRRTSGTLGGKYVKMVK